MKNVAILTCSCITQDLACASYQCLKAVQNNAAAFSRYGEEEVRVTGIINCAGCPTIAAPEKILTRVKSLTWLPIDALHLSSCMMALCPFKAKYLKILKERYPELEIVVGTHDLEQSVAPESSRKILQSVVSGLLRQPRKTMADITRIAVEKDGNFGDHQERI